MNVLKDKQQQRAALHNDEMTKLLYRRRKLTQEIEQLDKLILVHEGALQEYAAIAEDEARLAGQVQNPEAKPQKGG
jgi:hypothetical protein